MAGRRPSFNNKLEQLGHLLILFALFHLFPHNILKTVVHAIEVRHDSFNLLQQPRLQFYGVRQLASHYQLDDARFGYEHCARV